MQVEGVGSQGVGEQRRRGEVPPGEVGGPQQAVVVDEAGQSERDADFAGAADGIQGEDVGGQGRQPGEDLGGVGGFEIVDDDALGQDLAGQVDDAYRHARDVDLLSDGDEGARRRRERDRGAARPGGVSRLEFGEDAGRDEFVGQSRGRRAGHPGRRGDVGPGDGIAGGEDLIGEQCEVGGAQTGLAC